VTEEELLLKVANMDFNLCVMVDLLKTVVCRKFWTRSYFLGIMWLITYFGYDLNYL
jgi:hypothetical protein